LHSAPYHRPLSSGRDPSAALTSGSFLPSGRDPIFQANTPLLYSAFYYRPFSSGRDPLVILTSGPFLFSSRNPIFRANTFLLYSAFYYYPFFSSRDFLIVFASYSFSRAASVFLLSVINLSLRVVLYYSLVFQLLLAAIVVLVVRIYPTSAKYLK
jgi:hypothetical protein